MLLAPIDWQHLLLNGPCVAMFKGKSFRRKIDASKEKGS
jgi:hypothetical protein